MRGSTRSRPAVGAAYGAVVEVARGRRVGTGAGGEAIEDEQVRLDGVEGEASLKVLRRMKERLPIGKSLAVEDQDRGSAPLPPLTSLAAPKFAQQTIITFLRSSPRPNKVIKSSRSYKTTIFPLGPSEVVDPQDLPRSPIVSRFSSTTLLEGRMAAGGAGIERGSRRVGRSGRRLVDLVIGRIGMEGTGEERETEGGEGQEEQMSCRVGSGT